MFNIEGGNNKYSKSKSNKFRKRFIPFAVISSLLWLWDWSPKKSTEPAFFVTKKTSKDFRYILDPITKQVTELLSLISNSVEASELDLEWENNEIMTIDWIIWEIEIKKYPVKWSLSINWNKINYTILHLLMKIDH